MRAGSRLAAVATLAGALAMLAGPSAAVEPSPEKMQAWASRQHVVDKIADLDAIYSAEIVAFNAGIDTSQTAKRGSKKVDKVRGPLTHSPDKRLNKLMNKA